VQLQKCTILLRGKYRSRGETVISQRRESQRFEILGMGRSIHSYEIRKGFDPAQGEGHGLIIMSNSGVNGFA
jgi:hypothetical protein